MAVFRFRLASVLRYRERVKEAKRLELRALEEAGECLVSEIRMLEQALVRQTREMEEQEGKILSAAEIKIRGLFSHGVAQTIRKKNGLLAMVREKLREKRTELVQANTEVKSLERLEHRSLKNHRMRENREEQKLVDESGQRRYSHPGDGKKFP